uniref:Uncharacterized protein n=1 Tax=Sphaerodactylus townsendi TaxID=933632 RepID=A0ACB8FIM3_9SAUR
MNKTRKASLIEKSEKTEMELKLDYMIEMMNGMQKDNTKHFNELEGKINEMDNKFNKVSTEINELKNEIKIIKDLGQKVGELEQRCLQMEDQQKESEKRIVDWEDEFRKLENQMLLVELHQKQNILRLRGVPEKEGEKIRKEIIINLAKYLDTEEDVLEEDIEKIFRINTKQGENRRERDILIFFSRLKTKEEILKKNTKSKLKINLKDVLILKEIPYKILRKRREYDFVTNILRRENIRYKWEDIEGFSVTYKEKKMKITTIQQGKDLVEQIENELRKKEDELSTLIPGDKMERGRPGHARLAALLRSCGIVNNDEPYRATECVFVSRRAPSAGVATQSSTQQSAIGAPHGDRRPLLTINAMDILPSSPSLLESGVSINMPLRPSGSEAQATGSGTQGTEDQRENIAIGGDQHARGEQAHVEEEGIHDANEDDLEQAMEGQGEQQVHEEGRPLPTGNEGQPGGPPEGEGTPERRATRERIRLRRVGVLADFARAMVEQGEAEAEERRQGRLESRQRFDTLMTAIDRGNTAIERVVDAFCQRVGTAERANTILEALVSHVQRGEQEGGGHLEFQVPRNSTPSSGRQFLAATTATSPSLLREAPPNQIRDMFFPPRGGSHAMASPSVLAPNTPEIGTCCSHRHSKSDKSAIENRPPSKRSLHFSGTQQGSLSQSKAGTRKSSVLGDGNKGSKAKRERLREEMEESSDMQSIAPEMGREASGRVRRQKQIFDL